MGMRKFLRLASVLLLLFAFPAYSDAAARKRSTSPAKRTTAKKAPAKTAAKKGKTAAGKKRTASRSSSRRSRSRRASLPAGPTSDRIREIQAALAHSGQACPQTGRMDAATVAALARFQAASKLQATGKLNVRTLKLLEKHGLPANTYAENQSSGVAEPQPATLPVSPGPPAQTATSTP